MDIDKKVNMLICKDNKQAYNAFQELLLISQQCNDLYPYFDTFVKMMNNPNHSYIRTRGLRLIAYQSKWDIHNQLNSIIEKWLEHIEDEKPITARQCIKDTVIIAKNKPELIDIILERLTKINKVYDDSMQNLIYKDRQKAIQQIKQLTWQMKIGKDDFMSMFDVLKSKTFDEILEKELEKEISKPDSENEIYNEITNCYFMILNLLNVHHFHSFQFVDDKDYRKIVVDGNIYDFDNEFPHNDSHVTEILCTIDCLISDLGNNDMKVILRTIEKKINSHF